MPSPVALHPRCIQEYERAISTPGATNDYYEVMLNSRMCRACLARYQRREICLSEHLNNRLGVPRFTQAADFVDSLEAATTAMREALGQISQALDVVKEANESSRTAS